jgi:predicted dehydrogenase
MTKPIRVGIVGAGIGANHIDAFRELPEQFAVEALCDLNGERARQVATERGVPTVLTSYDELLARDLDLIDVCTPSNLHFRQAKQALAAGRHVLVEKPLAGSLAEVDALIEAERKSGKRVAPVFQYRFSDGLQGFLRVKDAGLVGKPYVATVETHWRRMAAYYDNPWRGRFASELGGCLVTHAIHAHDILTLVMGPIASITARTATAVNPIETEDCAALLLEMKSGALVTLSVTLGAEEEISRLRFCFAGLTVESHLDPYNPGQAPWRFLTGDAALQKRIDESLAGYAPGPERWTGQFIRLHDALTEGTELPVTVADARTSIELITAAYHSAATGETVRLPIAKGHPAYSGWRRYVRTGRGPQSDVATG